MQDGDIVPGTPYYHQSLWHNLVLLATWGVPDIKLAFIDLVSGATSFLIGASRCWCYARTEFLKCKMYVVSAPQPVSVCHFLLQNCT